MSAIDFSKILNDLKGLVSKKNNRTQISNPVTQSTYIQSNLPLIFQAPVKNAKNWGNFDPTGKGTVGRVHKGLDMRAPGGTSIYPLARGVVSKVISDPKGGNTVTITHPNGYKSYYAHMSTISVKPGDVVDLKSLIGTVGDTGNSAGAPHLHLQVWQNGSLIDPRSLFSFEEQSVVNRKVEQAWLPEAKQIAKNWSIKEHLKDEKKPVIANRLIQIRKLASMLEEFVFNISGKQ